MVPVAATTRGPKRARARGAWGGKGIRRVIPAGLHALRSALAHACAARRRRLPRCHAWALLEMIEQRLAHRDSTGDEASLTRCFELTNSLTLTPH